MSVVKKSETTKKLERLAEKVPPPLSWLIPDPNDPTSYIHPTVAMTPLQGVRRILIPRIKVKKLPSYERFIWRMPPQEESRMVKVWQTVPREAQESLRDIKWNPKMPYNELANYLPFFKEVELGLPIKWALYKHKPRRTPYMGFAHELSHHEIQEMINKLASQKGLDPLNIPKSTSMLREAVTEWLARQKGHQIGAPFKSPSLYEVALPKPFRRLERKMGSVDDPYKYLADYIEEHLFHFIR